MNEKILSILKAGGAIVLAGILVFVLWRVIIGYQDDAKEYRTLIGNDIEHVGGYIQENTEILIELKGAVEANTVQTGRLERLIDLKL